MGVDECWPCNLRTNAGRMKFKNCINDGAGGIIKAENQSSKIRLVTRILFRFSRIVFPIASPFFPPLCYCSNHIVFVFPKYSHKSTHGLREEWPGGRQWSSTRVVPLSSQPAWITVNNRQPRENNDNWCVRCLSDMHKLAQDGEPRTALHPTAPPSDCDLHGN